MDFLDLTLPSVPENLALDEALLLEAEAGGPGEALRVWEWPTSAVVLGAGCRLVEDVNEEACHTGQVPIFRRASGGGTVLLGRGCLNYTLVLSLGRSHELTGIKSSYCYIFKRIVDGLTQFTAGVECAGTSDLATAGRKFSGNAQQRKRKFILHHGTLLYDFDIATVSTYLHDPRRQPKYRAARPHADFLVNLPATADILKLALRSAWSADIERREWPTEFTKHLANEKYQDSAWIRRR